MEVVDAQFLVLGQSRGSGLRAVKVLDTDFILYCQRDVVGLRTSDRESGTFAALRSPHYLERTVDDARAMNVRHCVDKLRGPAPKLIVVLDALALHVVPHRTRTTLADPEMDTV